MWLLAVILPLLALGYEQVTLNQAEVGVIDGDSITYRFELKPPVNSKYLSIVGTSSESIGAYVKLHSPPSPTIFDQNSAPNT